MKTKMPNVRIPRGYVAEVRYAKEWRDTAGTLASIMHHNRKEAQRWVDEDPRYRRVVPVVVLYRPKGRKR